MTHNEKSGVAHFVSRDDAECLAMIRELLSFLAVEQSGRSAAARCRRSDGTGRCPR